MAGGGSRDHEDDRAVANASTVSSDDEAARRRAESADTEIAGGRASKLPSSVRVGETLGGRYEILGELGRGGEGVVLRARDLKADAVVALKLLARDVTRTTERLARFRRELAVARKVTHPCVVRIHDLVELPDRFALSMELVEGEALDFKMARERRLSRHDLYALAADLSEALAAAHEAGVTHRDLKPANVLLRAGSGRAVVTDFGVSRLHGQIGDASSPRDAGTSGPHGSSTPGAKLTEEGAIIGTPLYMAPEQLEGRTDIGPPADVYAFGVLLFEAATAQRPHEAPTVRALAAARREVPPAKLAALRPDLGAAFCGIVDRCLAVAPEDRFADGAALRAALDRAVAASRRGPSRVLLLGGGIVAAGLAVAAWWWGAAERAPSSSAPLATSAPASSVRPPFVFAPGPPQRITFAEGCEEYPSFTPDGEALVFDSDATGSESIVLMRLSDRSERVLTRGHGADFAGVVSPDGKSVAFLRRGREKNGVNVVPIDATPDVESRWLGPSNARPEWTPDGSAVWAGELGHLARYSVENGQVTARLDAPHGYVSLRGLELPSGGVLELFGIVAPAVQGGIALSAGGERRWLAKGGLGEVWALLPGGRALLATQQKATGGFELVSVPLDGGPVEVRPEAAIAPAVGLAVSRDGRRLAYSTCHDASDVAKLDEKGQILPLTRAAEWNENDVAVVDSDHVVVISDRDGAEALWLLDVRGAVGPRKLDLGRAGPPTSVSASHDGRLLAVSLADVGIAVLPSDGSAAAVLVTEMGSDDRPAFDRGDRALLFTRTDEDGRSRVMTVGVDGGEARPLVEGEGWGASASPVDDRVVYLAGEGTRRPSVPTVFDRHTGRRTPLSRALPQGPYGAPAFSPDGRRVALVEGHIHVVEVDAATGAVRRRVTAEGQQIERTLYMGDAVVLGRTQWIGDLWLSEGRFE